MARRTLSSRSSTGVALSDLVEGATLVRLDGGHEPHEADWQEIIAAIVAHTGR